MAPFRLQDLPGEMRNNVYSHVTLSDKLTLLTTSRTLNSEVSPFFYKEATYQIYVNVHYTALYTDYPITRPPPQHIKDKIQNLDVYWVLYGFEGEKRREGGVEALSWDPPIRRGLCRVFFGWYPGEAPSPMSFRDSDFGPLKTLAGFETVELRVGLKALGPLPLHHMLRRDACLPSRASQFLDQLLYPRALQFLYPRMSPMYEVLRNGLESAFGVPELSQNPPDHYLRFKPRKHSAATVEKV